MLRPSLVNPNDQKFQGVNYVHDFRKASNSQGQTVQKKLKKVMLISRYT